MYPRRIDLLISPGRECGVPNLLEAALKHLTEDKNSPETSSPAQLSCYKAIL